MSTFTHINMGTNWGGVKNVVSVNDDGEIVARDIQSAEVNTHIVDSNKRMRSAMRSGVNRLQEGGKLAARIPITLFQNWRREWDTTYRNSFTWQTFLASRVNDREFDALRLIDEKVYVPEHARG